jgi:hypothetical protein
MSLTCDSFYLHFGGLCCLHLQGTRGAFTLKMKAAYSSEIFVNIYQTAQHHNPEESNLQKIKLYTYSKINQATHLTKCKAF